MQSVTPTKPKLYLKTFHHDSEQLIVNHRIGGMGVLPASAQLEMVLAAMGSLTQAETFRLNDIVFLEPVMVAPGASLDVILELAADERGTQFQLKSSSDQVFCRGRVAAKQPGLPQWISLAEQWGRMSEQAETHTLENWYNTCGIEYGPCYRVIRDLYFEEDQAMALLNNGENLSSPYLLDPLLFDGALQSLGLWLNRTQKTGAEPYLPYYIGSLEVYAHLAGSVYSWCTGLRLEGTSAELLRAEFSLLNPMGRLLVKASGITLKRLDPAPRDARPPVLEPARLTNYFKQLTWVPVQPAQRGEAPEGDWLYLGAQNPWVQPLHNQLQAMGRTLVVAPAANSFRTSEGELERFGVVLCALGLNTDPLLLQEHVGAAIDLARALGNGRKRTRLFFLTANGQVLPGETLVQPAAGALWGVGRTVPQEYRLLATTCLDLPNGADAHQVVQTLLGEAEASTVRSELILRNGQLYAPHLDTTPAPAGQWRVRRAGRYLITGGMGDLGLVVAAWLAERGAASLILLNRTCYQSALDNLRNGRCSGLKDHQEKTLARLLEMGVEIIAEAMDIADVPALHRRLAGWGQIHGVVHCAGLLRDGLIRGKKREDVVEVLHAKALGAQALVTCLAHTQLDFMLLFSSLSGVFGNLGQADYAAANAFLDSLARQQFALGRKVSSLSWGPWRNLGMLADVRAGGTGTHGFESVDPALGKALLDQALAQPAAHWVLFQKTGESAEGSALPHETQNTSPSRLPVRAAEAYEANAMALAAGAELVVGGANQPTAQPSTIQGTDLAAMLSARLARSLARVVGVPVQQVDSATDMLALGLTSLMVVEMKGDFETDSLELDPSVFFRYAIVGDLAEHLAQAHPSEMARLVGAETPRSAPALAEQASLASVAALPASTAPSAPPPSGSQPDGLEQRLLREAARVLNLPHGELDPHSNLLELGLTPLGVMDIKAALPGGEDIDPSAFFRFPTVAELAVFLEETIPGLSPAAASEPLLPTARITAGKGGLIDEAPEFLRRRIDEISAEDVACKERGDYFYEPVIRDLDGAWVTIDDRRMLMLASYSYLNLIGHPRINAAATAAVDHFGTGTHGVRLLAGTNTLHRDLEQTIARFKHAEDAIVYSSGYITNVTSISALMRKGDVVIGDMYNHASIVDGCTQSGARFLMFGHNDMVDLERCLVKAGDAGKLVVVDAVFSMDGDIINLPEVVRLCKKYGAALMVDEAHSVGVLGKTGRGIEEHFGMSPGSVDLKMGTLSKTIPSVGGYVAGSKELIFALKNNARAFIFSAALPPAQAAAAKAAFEVILAEPERIERLGRNIRHYIDGLLERGFTTYASETSVVPVICNSADQAVAMARFCQDRNIFVQPIIYPAVPINAPRLRTIITAAHTPDDIDFVLETLTQAGRTHGLFGRHSTRRLVPA